MHYAVTSEQMKALDAHTIKDMGIPSLVLMERAALCTVEEIREPLFSKDRILLVCGSGNNGADGVAMARILHNRGVTAEIFLVGNKDRWTEEMRIQIDIAKNYRVPFVNNPAWDEYTTIVDAIFGVGLSRKVSGSYNDVITSINSASARVISVDIPSGIHGNTGEIMGTAVRADKTVTFAFPKAGLYFYPGAEYAGELAVADIGIQLMETGDTRKYYSCMDESELGLLPKRQPSGNKGNFGKVLMIAGTKGMSGAAFLASNACLATGAGMVRIHTREENRIILQTQLPEAMLSVYGEADWNPQAVSEAIQWADVIAIGPGIGKDPMLLDMIAWILANCRKPMVLDADCLNLLSTQEELLAKRSGPCVITPHMGEMARLLHTTVSALKKEFPKNVQAYGRSKNLICVCKDARTVTCLPDGACYLNLTGNEGMATAGAGDVLTGVIAGLLAQGLPAEKAAPLGVYIHGRAGDIAKEKLGSYSLLARDIIRGLAPILRERG